MLIIPVPQNQHVATMKKGKTVKIHKNGESTNSGHLHIFILSKSLISTYSFYPK